MREEAALTQVNSITESLGVRGWRHLDAIILAALATEAPLLLIGPHGTAKSLLVERVARTLNASLRHYNAALLNYDDLVGIPMPDETGESLHFITTPGTIWDAGFVFFDEISRCRADLQNKLFPIIHERRVIGVDLDKLKYRWAAMNPPAPEPDATNMSSANSYYIGSEPLDPALTDRFPYIVPVPGWGDISKEDRRKLILEDDYNAESNPIPNFTEMVEQCAGKIQDLKEEFSEWLGDYIVSIVDLLEQAGLPQSPRRAAMLARSIVAIHAARLILEGDEIDPEESAEMAIIFGVPQNATDVPPAQIKIIALHKQAWEITEYLEDDSWRQVMEEFDAVRRVALADQLGFNDADISRLVTQAIGAEDSDARQIGLATAMFLAFSKTRNLDPSAFEPLAQLAYHILEPRQMSISANTSGTQQTYWNEITGWIESQRNRKDSYIFRLQRNYLLYGVGGLWEKHNWREAITQFKEDLLLFGIEDDKE